MHEAPPSRFTITFDPEHSPLAEHALTSEYVETFYLPLIGPSGVVMLRAFGRIYSRIANITATPTTYIPIDPFAQSLGLASRKTGLNTRPFRDVLARLELPYRLIERTGPHSLTVAGLVPTLSPSRIERLPAHLQELHNAQLASEQRPVAQYV